MSVSFVARFDTTQLKLPQILDQLAGLFGELGVRFQNSATRLIEHDGWPTVSASCFEPIPVQDMSEVGSIAAQWWGVGLYCVSLPLALRLGRGDWMEVDFQLFRAPNKRWTLNYTESRTVQRHRIEVEDAARELYELQLRLCAALGLRFSVYDEEDYNLGPVPTLKEVEHRLEACARGELGCSIVVATSEMTLERARELAGPRANLVRLSTTGHLLFPFLLPDKKRA
jgi:hypothetical protein